MKKNFLLLVLLSSFALQHLSAQVPGYRGKRFSVGYNASSFFYFSSYAHTPEGILGILGSTRLSYKSELYVNYTLSRKVSLSFSYYHGKQKNQFAYPSDAFLFNRLNIFEVNLRFFKKNFVAPVGLYNQFGIGYVSYGVPEDFSSIYISPRGTYDYTCFKFSYHIGKTNPIGHNLYINTAFGLNLFAGGDYEGLLADDQSSSNDRVLNTCNHALRAYNTFEIKIGLGWLAF